MEKVTKNNINTISNATKLLCKSKRCINNKHLIEAFMFSRNAYDFYLTVFGGYYAEKNMTNTMLTHFKCFKENNWYLASIMCKLLGNMITLNLNADNYFIARSMQRNLNADGQIGSKKILQVLNSHINRMIRYGKSDVKHMKRDLKKQEGKAHNDK